MTDYKKWENKRPEEKMRNMCRWIITHYSKLGAEKRKRKEGNTKLERLCLLVGTGWSESQAAGDTATKEKKAEEEKKKLANETEEIALGFHLKKGAKGYRNVYHRARDALADKTKFGVELGMFTYFIGVWYL